MFTIHPSITKAQNLTNASTADECRNDVFISYSRKDQQFVRTLDAAFKQLNRDPWVDWDDIQKGEQWWTAIQRGIEAADTFIFVISPDSLASPVCRQEIEHAAKYNKRILPIVRREGFASEQVHPAIARYNWLFFRETENFNAAFQELLKAIDTDVDYVHAHTRLLIRAIEWQNKYRNQSYLLRGIDLEEAEHWFVQSAGKEPKPTELQAQYINASRRAEAAKQKARQKAKWVVVNTVVLANMLLTAAGCCWFYSIALKKAKQEIQDDMVNALHVGLSNVNGDNFATLASLSVPQGITPTDNPLYQEHQLWLLKVHRIFAKAFPRTYIRAENSKQLLWIGDVSRDLKISRTATDFLDSYSADHSELKVYDGATTIIMKPYSDELGNWVSASAPIKNSAGAVVGGMRVDFQENELINAERRVRNVLIVVYVILFLWLFALSLIILRATRPAD